MSPENPFTSNNPAERREFTPDEAEKIRVHLADAAAENDRVTAEIEDLMQPEGLNSGDVAKGYQADIEKAGMGQLHPALELNAAPPKSSKEQL